MGVQMADDWPESDAATTPGGKKTTAVALAELALARYRLGVTEGGEPFAVAHTLPHVARLLRGGQGSLRAELAGAYYGLFAINRGVGGVTRAST